MPTRTAAAVASLLLATSLFAADTAVDGVRFGDAVVGKKPTADDLKGKVVLVELWGIN